jgi:hypothetical protein
MWRHGDVFIAKCEEIPAQAKELPHLILARGEITGHAHRIRDRESASLYREGDSMYLRVCSDFASLVHEEHAEILLPQGIYRAWIQREYSPKEIRRVVD